MEGEGIVSASLSSVPSLDISRAYCAKDAASFLGITTSALNDRIREGVIKPIFSTGDRRYSGYDLASLLHWPLSDDPLDYMPGKSPGRLGERPLRIIR